MQETFHQYYDGLRPSSALRQEVLKRVRAERQARRLLAAEYLGSAAACLLLAVKISALDLRLPEAGPGQAASVFGSCSGPLIGGGLFVLLAALFTARYRKLRRSGRPRPRE